MYDELFQLNKNNYKDLAKKLYSVNQKKYGGSSLESYEFIVTYFCLFYKKNFSQKELEDLITDSMLDGGIDAFYFSGKTIDIFDFKSTAKGVSDVDLERVKLTIEKYMVNSSQDFTGDESIQRNVIKIQNNLRKKIKLIIVRKSIYTKEDLMNGKYGNKKIRSLITNLESWNIDVEFHDVRSLFLKKFNIQSKTEMVSFKVGKNIQNNGNKNIITKISLETIFSKLIEKYGKGVINSNVRDFLGGKKFSSKLIETLKADPDNFYVYHNGITITCDKLNFDTPTINSIELHNPQVVNGAQTLFSLFNASNSGEIEEDCLKKASVICKIVEANEQFAVKICETSNTQNAIKPDDLRSNDEIQVFLEEYLNVVSEGKYFYKRKKGGKKSGAISVTSAQLFQWVYAAFIHMPASAKNEKQFLFDVVTKKGRYNMVVDQIKSNLTDLLRLCDTAFFVKKEIKKEKNKNKKGFLRTVEFYLIARLFMLNKLDLNTFNGIYKKLNMYSVDVIRKDNTKNNNIIFNQSVDAWKHLVN